MKRRAFVERLGLSSVGLASLAAMASSIGRRAEAQGHHHQEVSGPLANATVSFGYWFSDPPLNRFPNASPIAGNGHQLIPHTARIKAGGTINFVISGLHQVIVYDKGTEPGQIQAGTTTPTTGTPAGVPLIDDPVGRIYRGPDPSLYPRDRVEVVHFAHPGRYLVICGVQPHFVNDGMFGFVRVLP